MLKVGRYFNPMPDDLLLGDWPEAHAYARELAQQSDTTPIAIRGKHDETLCLFLNGEGFRRV
ncbi:hypothetical protein VPH49_22365 [Pseudomonas luteola]|uniref:hypothetical protein n=1 Tax=Pseudomonas luteola TaxID=47886 RepID=UPI00388E8601